MTTAYMMVCFLIVMNTASCSAQTNTSSNNILPESIELTKISAISLNRSNVSVKESTESSADIEPVISKILPNLPMEIASPNRQDMMNTTIIGTLPVIQQIGDSGSSSQPANTTVISDLSVSGDNFRESNRSQSPSVSILNVQATVTNIKNISEVTAISAEVNSTVDHVSSIKEQTKNEKRMIQDEIKSKNLSSATPPFGDKLPRGTVKILKNARNEIMHTAILKNRTNWRNMRDMMKLTAANSTTSSSSFPERSAKNTTSNWHSTLLNSFLKELGKMNLHNVLGEIGEMSDSLAMNVNSEHSRSNSHLNSMKQSNAPSIFIQLVYLLSSSNSSPVITQSQHTGNKYELFDKGVTQLGNGKSINQIEENNAELSANQNNVENVLVNSTQDEIIAENVPSRHSSRKRKQHKAKRLRKIEPQREKIDEIMHHRFGKKINNKLEDKPMRNNTFTSKSKNAHMQIPNASDKTITKPAISTAVNVLFEPAEYRNDFDFDIVREPSWFSSADAKMPEQNHTTFRRYRVRYSSPTKKSEAFSPVSPSLPSQLQSLISFSPWIDSNFDGSVPADDSSNTHFVENLIVHEPDKSYTRFTRPASSRMERFGGNNKIPPLITNFHENMGNAMKSIVAMRRYADDSTENYLTGRPDRKKRRRKRHQPCSNDYHDLPLRNARKPLPRSSSFICKPSSDKLSKICPGLSVIPVNKMNSDKYPTIYRRRNIPSHNSDEYTQRFNELRRERNSAENDRGLERLYQSSRYSTLQTDHGNATIEYTPLIFVNRASIWQTNAHHKFRYRNSNHMTSDVLLKESQVKTEATNFNDKLNDSFALTSHALTETHGPTDTYSNILNDRWNYARKMNNRQLESLIQRESSGEQMDHPGGLSHSIFETNRQRNSAAKINEFSHHRFATALQPNKPTDRLDISIGEPNSDKSYTVILAKPIIKIKSRHPLVMISRSGRKA